jgi:phage terminase small subunit
MEHDLAVFLTPKQRAFCDEYMIDRNATAAALRAGYSQSIALNGYLMTIPKIKQCLQSRCQEAADKAQVTHDMVLRELCKIAFGNMRDYFLDDGGLKPIHALTEDQAAALWSTSVTEKGDGANSVATTKIRMYSKLAALDKIAKHLNFYGPEKKETEKEYIYLDNDMLMKDDCYGDDDYIADDDTIPDIPVTADGKVICDSCEMIRFKVDLDETYDENLERLKGYETQLGRPIEYVKIDAEETADQTDQPLCIEINARIRKLGYVPNSFDTKALCYHFMWVRKMEFAKAQKEEAGSKKQEASQLV